VTRNRFLDLGLERAQAPRKGGVGKARALQKGHRSEINTGAGRERVEWMRTLHWFACVCIIEGDGVPHRRL